MFISLFLSRVGLMSFLHYYGVAQASPLYLISGAFSYFVASAIALMYLVQTGMDWVRLSMHKSKPRPF